MCPTLQLQRTAACEASRAFTVSQSLLRVTSTQSVMPSNHLILCCPLLLLPPIFPSSRVFPNEPALCIRWPKDWSFSFSSPAALFSSRPQSFPVSGSYPMSWLFASGGQRIVPSAAILPGDSGLISFRMDWLDLLESKGLSRVFTNTTVQKHQLVLSSTLTYIHDQ